MERPVCAYCHNKVNDTVYIWIEKEQKVIHKVCKIITDEMRKDIIIEVNPVQLGIKQK